MKFHKLGLLLTLAMVALFSAGCNLEGGEVTEEVLPTSTSVAQVTEEPTEEPTDLPTATATQQSAPTAAAPNCSPRTDWTATYTVVAGDTLASIASRSNTTIDQLTQGNCLVDANLISVGQVLRVPNSVAAATVVPTQSTGSGSCQYFTTGAPPIYETQAFLTQIETVVTNQRYPVTLRNDSYYQIQLPDGRRGWVQAVSGQLEGNCSDVFNYSEPYMGTNAPDYTCYYIGATAFEATIDQAGTYGFEQELQAAIAYYVDGRIPGKVRIFAGYEVPFPVWASLDDGRIIGECDSLPDASRETTQSVPKETYTNSEAGFSLQYPSNWPMVFNAHGLPGASVGNGSFVASYPTALGMPSDVVFVGWVIMPPDVVPGDAQATANQAAQDIIDANARLEVTGSAEAYTTPGGLTGWHFSAAYTVRYENYFFDLPGGSVLNIGISGGDIDLGMSVIESIQVE